MLVGVGEDVVLIHAGEPAVIHDEPALADDGLHVAGVEGITEMPGEVVLRQRRGGIVVEDDQIVRPAARRIVALDVRRILSLCLPSVPSMTHG